MRDERKSVTASPSSCAASARTSSAAATASVTSTGSARAPSSTSAAPDWKRARGAAGEFQSEARLSGAAGPREREQPRASKQGSQLCQLPAAADERARVGGEREGPGRAEGRAPLLELERDLRQLVSAIDGPVVVAVLGQELAAVESDCGPIGSRGLHLPGVPRRLLEVIDVDIGREHEQPVP